MINKLKERFILSSEESNNSRNNNFNMMRFVAAAMVIIGHMCHLTGIEVITFGDQAVSTIAVKVFFLVSGYLITESFMRDSNILRYSIRRFFRIIPGLLFLCLVTVFIIGPLFTTLDLQVYFASPDTYKYVIKNTLLFPVYTLPGLFTSNPYPNAVNGSLWSLPVEVLMYFLTYITLFVSRKSKRLEVLVAVVAVVLSLISILQRCYFPTYTMMFYGTNWMDAVALAPYFFIGSLVSFPNMRKFLNLQWACGLLLVFSMLRVNEALNEALFLIVLPYFVFSLALTKKPAFSKFFVKNDYSYGVYLYGFVIQQVLVQMLMVYGVSFNVYLVLSFILTLLFAIISWHLVEKPCQALGKKLLKLKFIKNL
ncbi:MAG: acyltransferase family protein [Eubacteriaceae bacterium]